VADVTIEGSGLPSSRRCLSDDRRRIGASPSASSTALTASFGGLDGGHTSIHDELGETAYVEIGAPLRPAFARSTARPLTPPAIFVTPAGHADSRSRNLRGEAG
jgi:hypothetical protein